MGSASPGPGWAGPWLWVLMGGCARSGPTAQPGWGRRACSRQLGRAGARPGLALSNGRFSRAAPAAPARIHGSASPREGRGEERPRAPAGPGAAPGPLPRPQHLGQPAVRHGHAQHRPHSTSLPELHVQAAAEIASPGHSYGAGAGCQPREPSAEAGVAPGPGRQLKAARVSLRVCRLRCGGGSET